jgi:hypothetical protein
VGELSIVCVVGLSCPERIRDFARPIRYTPHLSRTSPIQQRPQLLRPVSQLPTLGYLIVILYSGAGETDPDSGIDFGHLLRDIALALFDDVAFICDDDIPGDHVDGLLVLFVGCVCCDEDFESAG